MPGSSDEINRREFLRRLGCILAAGAIPGAVGYSLVEPGWLRVDRTMIPVPGLPPAFDGLRICQLSDLHHGPWVSLDHIGEAIDAANSLRPDLIVLTGDYVHRDSRYIEPVWRQMARLDAPGGVYAVLGNHDQWEDPSLNISRHMMKVAGITDLTNRGFHLSRTRRRLTLAGVGDLWTDTQKLHRALEGVPEDGAAILLSHNPDYNEEIDDARVKLMLAGHTHGGQIRLPIFGPLVVPSDYGQRYAGGLVRQGSRLVYISRGVGLTVLPVRFNCRPEINLLTLKSVNSHTNG